MLAEIAAAVFPLVCPGCGRPANPICDGCAQRLRAAPTAAPPADLDAWFAPFAYTGALRTLVSGVKYRRAHAATRWLAMAMCRVLPPPVPVVITWAPTTSERRRARGFDHAELLARRVARRLRRPVSGLLVRVDLVPQTGRPASERRRGPRFRARGRVPSSVLLVDDVATTGATLAAAAGVLRDAGAERIVALTAARTPPPGT